MGLLNDAIREHLELKRQHGADPSEVARLEDEALGSPVQGQYGDEETASQTYSDGHADPIVAEADQMIVETVSAADLGATGQETAELDMQLVLSSDELGSDDAHISTEDSPLSSSGGKVSDNTHQEVAGEIRTSAEGDLEDVLEETPDFLQETPEHERLWFEQRPPRDFDFDK
jgi:hypothetical protein